MPDPLPSYDDVILRPFTDDDVEMLCDLATDSYVSLIGSLPAHATCDQAREFIARQHDRLVTGAGFSFCAADLASGRALGTAGLWLADLAGGRASVGYTVAPRSRGRGVAVKALRALTGLAWTIPELFRVELYVEPRNLASIHVAEAGGYVREGLLRSHQQIGDRRADMFVYASVRTPEA